ncbi:hypothetical protein ACFQBQ_07575 [Granulicella cerasi]|uniref:Uncharacterized protein n=1 Tax=Granulicella cerasi TaxID=741063 RepID=A0ABW1Z9Q8_9BACT|nr:hypothetical protein [Granulicella cerasi]
MSTTPDLLELDAERAYTITAKNRDYTLTCRRITHEDWLVYFAAISVTSRQEGADRIDSSDLDSARIALVERVLVRAEGYKVAGDRDLMQLENWRQLIPQTHRVTLGALLTGVLPVVNEDELIYPEGQEIVLEALWGGDGDGFTRKYTRLVHVLRKPTNAQFQRFRRAANTTRIIGGGRSGVTQYCGVQPLVVELYDELVISVDGYAFDGQPLTHPEAIKAEMDDMHKYMAAIQLFRVEDAAAAKFAPQTEAAA